MRPYYILLMGVKYAQIVFLAKVSGRSNDLKSKRSKPSINFLLDYGDDLQARLRDTNGEVVFLNYDSFQ